MSNGFEVKYSDLFSMSQAYKKKLDKTRKEIDVCSKSVETFINSTSFKGTAAESIKSYLEDVHITLLAAMRTIAQDMQDKMVLYKAGYYPVDNATNFVLNEWAMLEYKNSLRRELNTVLDRELTINRAIDSIADLMYNTKPTTFQLVEAQNTIDQEIDKLQSDVTELESITVQALQNSVEIMLDYLKRSVAYADSLYYGITSYRPDSFYTNKDVYTLSYLSEYFYKQHQDNQEIYDAIWSTEDELAAKAEQRKTEGVWKTIGGAGLVVTGAVCIVVTAGAATPIVVTGAVAGGGTIAFGVADAAEGGREIYLGKTGDIDTSAYNILRDTAFSGNEGAYQITENIFAFTASAMVPIASAHSAGTLTFRSGVVAVGKLAISDGVGAETSKIIMDKTGNRTLSMFAGMAASSTTGVALNKIDSHYNISKLDRPFQKNGLSEALKK